VPLTFHTPPDSAGNQNHELAEFIYKHNEKQGDSARCNDARGEKGFRAPGRELFAHRENLIRTTLKFLHRANIYRCYGMLGPI
jgi:hypothetical protein